MSSKDIYKILSSKPHNKHFLDRYYKFIISRNESQILGYTENHHICPKAKDLFPEYENFNNFPWNRIKLSPREHFICHLLLYKAFGGSQIFAFSCMCNGQKSKYQLERVEKVNSKIYENLKTEYLKYISEVNKGFSTYYDSNKNIIRTTTDDIRVISGELVSLSKGRSFKKKTKFHYAWDVLAKRFPNRKIKLYFLDMKIEVLYYSDSYFEYIYQGWSPTITKEYKTKIAVETNKNMTNESRRKAAEKISKSKMGKTKPTVTKEQRIRMREMRSGILVRDELYYNIKTKNFIMLDPLYENDLSDFVKVFTTKNSRVIWDINNNKRFCSKECPPPIGYYDNPPFETKLIFDLNSKTIKSIFFKDLKSNYILINIPNGNRIKFICHDLNRRIYLNKEFINTYGIPLNCEKSKS